MPASKYIMESAPDAVTRINGKDYLYFGGTSYYSLHKHPSVLKAAGNALIEYGMLSATTRLGYGTTVLLETLEKRASEFFGTEDTAYLASGFLSSMAGVQALQIQEGFDLILLDEFSHYSNWNAAFSVEKPVYTFHHPNIEDLKRLKEQVKPGQKPLVISDGVFPVFGEIAPIEIYLELLESYNGILWIDDAHGMGVLGKQGRGVSELSATQSDRIYTGGTLSKAFGGFGGIIPGTREFISEIKKGPVMNGANMAPSAALAASLEGIDILRSEPERKERLWANARHLKRGFRELGIPTNNTEVPIAAWEMGTRKKMERIREKLMDRGIAIQYTSYIGAGKEGVLRAVVFESHTTEQIDFFLSELKYLLSIIYLFFSSALASALA